MFSLFFLIAALLLGWQIVKHIPLVWYQYEALAAAVVIGLLITTWTAFLSSWLFGYGVGLDLALLLIFIVVILLRGAKPDDFSELPKYSYWGITILLTLGLAYLFFTHLLEPGPAGWYSGGATWGDLALHLSLISHFSFPAQFNWDFSLLYGSKLTYPFLIDFLSAVLYRGGWNLRWSLLVPSLLLAASFIQLLYFLSLRLFKKPSAAIFTLLIFLLGGSFWGLSLIHPGLLQDYTNVATSNLHFTNVITTLLLPQRGFLFGFPLFLLILLFLYQNLPWPTALLAALLPLAHTHTFFTALPLILLLFTWRQQWLPLLIVVLAAFPQLYWQFTANDTSHFIQFQLGWMHADQSILLFWLRQAAPVFLVGLLMSPWLRRQGRFVQLLAGLSLGLFLLINLAIFQPYDYDNLKFLIYAYLLFALLAGVWLATQKAWVVLPLLVALIASGSLAVIWESQQHILLFSTADIQFADQVRAQTKPDDLILTDSRHNNPVPTLTGRPIVMGYPGWLWSYGLPYLPVQSDVAQLYLGLNPKKYPVKWVVSGPPWQLSPY